MKKSLKKRIHLIWPFLLILAALTSLLAACGAQPGIVSASGSTTTTTTTSAAVPTGTVTGDASCAGQSALSSIRMLDQSNGWALNKDTVLKTTNGGASWTCAGPANTKLGQGVAGDFVDAQNAWVATSLQGGKVVVLHTADGGQTWQSAPLIDPQGTYLEILDMPHFLNKQEGFIEVSNNGGPGAGSESVAIFHSIDGGQSWSKIASSTDQNSGLPNGGLKTGISFKDTQNGWATGHDASSTPWLYVTHNGGKTWHLQSLSYLPGTDSSNPADFFYNTTPPVFFGNGAYGQMPVYVSGALNGLPSTQNTLLYTTYDGGQTWQPAASIDKTALLHFSPNNLYIADSKHAYASNTNDGSLYATSDGGKSWQKIAANVANGIVFLNFADATHGWLLNSSGLQHSNDGGQTWQSLQYTYPH